MLGELHADLAGADVAGAMTADTKELHGAVSKLGKVGGSRVRSSGKTAAEWVNEGRVNVFVCTLPTS